MDSKEFIEAFVNAVNSDKIADDHITNADILLKTLKDVVKKLDISRY